MSQWEEVNALTSPYILYIQVGGGGIDNGWVEATSLWAGTGTGTRY